jgi:hypothetical protein
MVGLALLDVGRAELEQDRGMGTDRNVAKISALWACSYAPKGLRGFR